MLKRAFSKINKVAGSSLFRQRALPVALLNAQKSANFSTFTKYNHKVQSIHSFSRRGFASLPEHTKLTMPALSPTMEQGNIVKWHVQVGAKVEPGFQICDVETDKATMAFEVQDAGYIAAILVPEGSKGVQVGKPVAILVEEEADLKAFSGYKGEEGGEQAAPKQQKEEKKPEQKEQKEEKKAAAKPKKAAKAPSKKLPEHSKVAMPALSPTMDTGKITQWQKKEGDKIEAGDVLANVETDKATIDFVYQDDGYLAKILVQEGQGSIKVGDIVAIVVDEQADVKAFQDYAGEESQAEEAEAEEAEPEQETKPKKQEKAAPSEQAAQRASGERVIASPLAKKTAQDQNIDLSQVEGSGPGGRVLKHNVDEFAQKGGAKAQPAEAKEVKKEAPKEAKAQPKAQEAPKFVEGQNPYTDIPLTSVREIIAKRLLQSKTTIPHYYLETEIVMDEAIKIRSVLNESSKSKISFNDMFVKAAAHACVEVPEVNSQWQGSAIRRFKNADISVAVDTGSGLITPIVFAANTKGLSEISNNTKDLIEKAKKNALKPQEFQGGTFSISNLGMMGISNFSAVINPPQSAILAIGKTDSKIILVDGAPKSVNVMNVTLSCDHRVIDGAVGARWLEAFKKYLEKPLTLLL